MSSSNYNKIVYFFSCIASTKGLLIAIALFLISLQVSVVLINEYKNESHKTQMVLLESEVLNVDISEQEKMERLITLTRLNIVTVDDKSLWTIDKKAEIKRIEAVVESIRMQAQEEYDSELLALTSQIEMQLLNKLHNTMMLSSILKTPLSILLWSFSFLFLCIVNTIMKQTKTK